MNKRRAKTLFYRKWINYTLLPQGRTHCEECGNKMLYFMDYDADFCPLCNIWQSTWTCNDINCSYCAGRPETPREALTLAKLKEEASRYDDRKDRRIRRYARRYRANLKHKKRGLFVTH